ncbi:hypothetical protein ACS0TY_000245 [Phlomoides rotata]
MREIFLPLAFLLVFTLLLQTADINVAASEDAETKAYIVYMGERKNNDVEQIKKSHHEMLSSVLGSEAALDSMIYTYKYGFSAFAAKMTESQAKYFEGLPGVVKVFQNRFYELHTTRSNNFLDDTSSTSQMPPSMPDDISDVKLTDDGVIIGVLDSGIWPESESFNDGGLGPIPARWKGFCQAGQAFNPARHCNRKLIGARYFIRGFLAAYGRPFNATANKEYLSPRDGIGHGTHVTSTAGGTQVNNVSLSGLAFGTARGSSPRARLAMYKVAWMGQISSVDVLKAFDEAINDGVDILSLSLGFGLPLYPETDKRDIIYYGSFHAVRHGITVVCSAGNKGSLSETVSNVAPWVITVGASTLDRLFPSPIILGNNQILTGQSMYVGRDTGVVNLAFFRDSADAEGPRYCEDITARDTWVSGRVVLCFTLAVEDDVIIKASTIVRTAGGLGLIATKKTVKSLFLYYNRNFPVVLVTFDVGTTILNYIRFSTNPKVRLRPARTYIGNEASTYVASFSSRGPNSLSPAILKPDVAAPGVDIIAAVPPNTKSPRGYLFKSGTSMACPHVSGLAARLKALYPNWSPAAIKSAITTSAWSSDPYSGEPLYAQGQITKTADPFDYGGGLANPSGAKIPGLVYDMGTQDYVNYLCAMGYPQKSINQLTGKPCLKSANSILDFNLPSITIPTLRDSVTVTRTVTNVGNPNSKYKAFIIPPPGTAVEVNPKTLVFNPNVKKMRFKVTVTTFHNITTEYYFGWLTWADGTHIVKIPISVRTVSHTSLW